MVLYAELTSYISFFPFSGVLPFAFVPSWVFFAKFQLGKISRADSRLKKNRDLVSRLALLFEIRESERVHPPTLRTESS